MKNGNFKLIIFSDAITIEVFLPESRNPSYFEVTEFPLQGSVTGKNLIIF